MRDLYRSIARAHMQDAGVKRMNAKRHSLGNRSIFSAYWRFFAVYDPSDKARNRRNDGILTRLVDRIKARAERRQAAAVKAVSES